MSGVWPLGPTNSPSEFQNMLNEILNPYYDHCIVYIDDILIFSSSVDPHFKLINVSKDTVKRNG